MCDENINQIISLDFATTNDELNWINNSSNPIVTEDGKLVLQPESQFSTFTRTLGFIDIANNRVRFKLNLEIYCPATNGSPIVNYVVQIYNGISLVGQSTIYIDSIEAGQTVSYSLDRTYPYEELSGTISIKIKAMQGYQNELRLEKLDAWDSNFCEENVRTYFVFDGLFEGSQTAQSAGIRLLSWKVDGTETLTSAFDSQNQSSVGGNPLTGWKFAKANIDGGNRLITAVPIERNTFNPFSDEFGLIFENITGNYYGGKPIGTVGGQDFGAGIMQLGFEKPVILNGILEPKAGAFFIDIDYTKSLLIEVDVLINDSSTNVYNNPNIYRKYFISWNADTCKKDFYYRNQLETNPQINDQFINGFLTGLTGITKNDTILPCGQTLNYTGNQGSYTFTLDLGTTIGMAGIDYNAQSVPDKFDINWGGINLTSNFRGSASYNQALINAGVPPSQIATATPSNGAGILRFFKTATFPTFATVTVYAPLAGTAWNLKSVCPLPYMEVWLYRANCGDDITGTPTAVVYMPVENPLTYIPNAGDIFYNQIGLTTPYNGNSQIFRMKIPLGTNGTFSEPEVTFNVSNIGVVSNVEPC